MIRNDIRGIAEAAEALEDEIHALRRLDPYDPQIPMLVERLHATIETLYEVVPRGV